MVWNCHWPCSVTKRESLGRLASYATVCSLSTEIKCFAIYWYNIRAWLKTREACLHPLNRYLPSIFSCIIPVSHVANVIVRCVLCCVQCSQWLVDQCVLSLCFDFDTVIHRLMWVVNMSITYPIAKLKSFSSMQFVEKSAVIGKFIKKGRQIDFAYR